MPLVAPLVHSPHSGVQETAGREGGRVGHGVNDDEMRMVSTRRVPYPRWMIHHGG